jgi:hypothetical protein
MFGQKDDESNNQNENTDPNQAVDDAAAKLLASDPSSDNPINAGPPPIASAATAPPTGTAWQHPGMPASDNPSDQIKDVISPAGGFPSAPSNRTVTDTDLSFPPDNTSTDDAVKTALVSDDDVSSAELIDIKQKALSELIPLIDKLDQPPLEKFRTIMMMIQASDDQRLVEKAYESAHAIEDETDRAQALLDIVNEINYFTQPNASENTTGSAS